MGEGRVVTRARMLARNAEGSRPLPTEWVNRSGCPVKGSVYGVAIQKRKPTLHKRVGFQYTQSYLFFVLAAFMRM